MTIAIKERLRPFSHKSGEVFLMPKTTLMLRIFPTRLEGEDLSGVVEPFYVDFPWKGPVKEFTAQLDLERLELVVFGKSKQGYFRYHVFIEGNQLKLLVKKKGEQTLAKLLRAPQDPPKERLSLGSHRSQEWSGILKRADFKELFPLWLKVAGSLPQVERKGKGGPFTLLEKCESSIQENRRQEIEKVFYPFFLGAFRGVFVPQLFDPLYQGLYTDEGKGSALYLLQASAELIRSLFYKKQADQLSILPCLSNIFHAGRFIDIQVSDDLVLSFEWTKHKLRRLSLKVKSPHTIQLKLPKGISSCRVSQKNARLQKKAVAKEGGLELSLQGHTVTRLDRFHT